MEDFDWCVISEADIAHAKQYVEAKGVCGILEFILHKADTWRYIKIHIGISGESAVGKSSFINCVRDVTADDIEGAAVGTGDTTTEPTKYCHPYNEDLVFWDLPGVGTPKYPRDERYLNRINFEQYDFFLILSDNRFSNNDVWLAKEIDKRGKRFFFVRTKIDEAMENEREVYGDDFSETAVLDKINKDCHDNFKAAQLPGSRIFCISNYHRDMWQFEELMEQLIVALPEMKRAALVLSIGPISKQVIREKTKFLTDNIWKMSFISAMVAASCAAVPVPIAGGAISISLDIGLLIWVIDFYLKQYGLDDESLRHLSERTNTKVDYYVQSLKFASTLVTNKQGIRKFIIDTMKKEAVKQAEKRTAQEAVKLIPVIGMTVAGGVSYGTFYYFLRKTIQRFEADAMNVVDAAIRMTSSQLIKDK